MLSSQDKKKIERIIDFVYDIEDISVEEINEQYPDMKERAEKIRHNITEMIKKERKIY